MRGLGVILIVVGHLWRWPPGAYAMLDMFFVLSGFLITAILVGAFPKYGPGFFVAFYLSRLRRLAPAAALVLVVTVVLSYVIFSSARGRLVAEDGVWALLFSVNWHFSIQGTDYFQAQIDSPLLHYWSLSVEEQFYAVWPLLIFAILWLVRRMRSSESALLVGLGLVTAASFGYSLWHSVASPAAAYFSTFDRAWEFGVGGLVAVLSPRLARLPHGIAMALGWGGALGMGFTIFLLPYGVPFPAPWGLLPVLLTAAIIAGGIERSTKHLVMLDNRPMVYVGDISYSVYLWHLPINLFLRPFLDGAWTYYVAAIVLTFAAAMTSYYLVERPMREARWLMTSRERRRGQRRAHQNAKQLHHGVIAAGVTVALVLSVAALQPETPPVPAAARPAIPADATAPATPLAKHQAALREALRAPSFPDFEPSLEDLAAGSWTDAHVSRSCITTLLDGLAGCRFGPRNAERLAVVVGDSAAVTWSPGIQKALVPEGWAFQQLTYPMCPSWTLSGYVTSDRRPFPECVEHHQLVQEFVEKQQPDLLILSSAAGQVQNAQRSGLALVGDAVAIADSGLTASLEAWASHAAATVVLSPPPSLHNLVECVTRLGTPDDCVSTPDSAWADHVAGESAAAAAHGAHYVQAEGWFCIDSSCPAFVGTTPVTVDGSHLTVAYSERLAPLLKRALLQPVATQ